MEKPTILTLKNVSKIYPLHDIEVHALNGLNFEVKENDFIAILGPSGSGKSTLMNIIGCLDDKTSGEFIFSGIKIEQMNEKQLANVRNKNIGFIFQNFELLPRLTAIDNVILPLIYQKINKKDRKIRAANFLNKVGLKEKHFSYPNQLSGGQQQRVAIARALVTNPQIILADEPTGALDQNTGIEIMNLFQRLHLEGKTIIMITHSEKIAQYAKTIYRMVDGKEVKTC